MIHHWSEYRHWGPVQHAVLVKLGGKEQVMVEMELQMKVEVEAELQGRLREEEGERMEDWDYPEQCERLEQQ